MVGRKPWIEIEVGTDEDGLRLDQFLAAAVEGVSRREAQRMVAGGLVEVDGRPAPKGRTLSAGGRVAVFAPPAPRVWAPLPDAGVPLGLVHEDAHLIVVEKPPGVPSVPRREGERGTAAGGIAARFPECAALGRRPGDGGLVQRLDTETSGLLLAARDAEVFRRLVELQADRRIEKRYLALVEAAPGEPPAGIEQPLGPAGKGAERVRPDPRGAPAVTRLSVMRRSGAFLLVEAVLHRGVRHQIRAHLAFSGFPIAGDRLYGGPPVPGLGRLFLHASGLRLPHPVTGEPLAMGSPLPPELLWIVQQYSVGQKNI